MLTPNEPNKIFITWDEVQHLCQKFAWGEACQKFTHIIPIARGGLIPATIISHEMNDRPLLSPIQASAYRGSMIPGTIIAAIPEYTISPETTLIVDDILDTGATTNQLLRHPVLGQCTFVYLTHKSKTALRPNQIVLSEVVQNSWVVFPWEHS